MTYRTAHISSSKEHPNLLTIQDRSHFRDSVFNGVDSLCALTRHRVICSTVWGQNLYNKLWTWTDNAATDLYSVDIDRAGISSLSHDPEDWWPGDPDEDD